MWCRRASGPRRGFSRRWSTDEIERIAEIKSQAEAVRVYSTQKQLGKDAQLAAAEIVRRAERGIGVAIRRGQQTGEIARRGDRGGCGAAGIYGGNPMIGMATTGFIPARFSGTMTSAPTLTR